MSLQIVTKLLMALIASSYGQDIGSNNNTGATNKTGFISGDEKFVLCIGLPHL